LPVPRPARSVDFPQEPVHNVGTNGGIETPAAPAEGPHRAGCAGRAGRRPHQADRRRWWPLPDRLSQRCKELGVEDSGQGQAMRPWSR